MRDNKGKFESSPDDIVISGVSGRFPKSDDLDEFAYNMYNGIDMASFQFRWDLKLYDQTAQRFGGVKSFDKFDDEFFGIDRREAEVMDPVQRKMLEVTYEALIDAGVNPDDIRGDRTGLFFGDCFPRRNLNDDAHDERSSQPPIFIREAYHFDIRGPVAHVDTACASSLNSFHEAILALKSCLCDTAIASGANSVFDPYCSYQMSTLGFLSPMGACRSLSADADGYLRSEAAVAVILQKRKDAKRVYMTVMNSVTNCDGYKSEGITFPGGVTQENLMKMAYEKLGVKPQDVSLVEGHSTGTRAGDPVETNAIHRVFCGSDRRKPLLFGAVKSNLGHTEGAAGLVAIAKTCMTFQKNCVAPNIHYKEPNPNLTGVMSGEIIPVTKPTPFHDDLIAINSFGFGGANVHAVMRSEKRSKENEEDNRQKIPRLILIQGRTESSVQHVYVYLQVNKNCQTPDFFYLLDNYAVASGDFKYRGYMIIDPSIKKPTFVPTAPKLMERKKTVLYFPGLNSKEKFVSNFPVELIFFRPYLNSLKRSKKIIERMGYNWTKIDPSFITTVNQIAWVDCLKKINFTPDQVIGSSQGELAAAYFTQHITAEDALMGIKINQDMIKEKVINCDNTKPDLSAWNLPREVLIDLCGGKPSWDHVTPDQLVQNGYSKDLVIEVAQMGLRTKNSRRDNGLEFYSTLSTLGDIYMNGNKIQINKMYGEPSLPLPSTTPSLSPLIKWNHSKPYDMSRNYVDPKSSIFTAKFKTLWFPFNPSDPEDYFLMDHKVDSRCLFPATGYLVIAISTLCRLKFISTKDASVELKDVTFMRATIVEEDKELVLTCRMDEETGRFEIHEKDILTVTGYAFFSSFDGSIPAFIPETPNVKYTMTSADVYKELRVRGYDYGTYFQAIENVTSDGLDATVIWRDTMSQSVRENLGGVKTRTDGEEMDFLRQLICFSDSMMQTLMMNPDSIGRGLSVPTTLKNLRFNSKALMDHVMSSPKFLDTITNSDSYKVKNHGCSFEHSVFVEGLQIIGLKTSLVKKTIDPVTTGKIVFTPMNQKVVVKRKTQEEQEDKTSSTPHPLDSEDFYPKDLMNSLIQFAIQNLCWKKTLLTVEEITAHDARHSFKKLFEECDKNSVYSDLIDFKYSMTFHDMNNNDQKDQPTGIHILMEKTFSEMTLERMKDIHSRLAENGFCLIFCDSNTASDVQKQSSSAGLTYIMEKCITCDDMTLSILVFKKVPKELLPKNQTIIRCSLKSYLWIEDLQKCLMTTSEDPDQKVWLVPDMDDDLIQEKHVSGLIGLTKSLRYETGGDKLRCILDFRTKSGIFTKSGVSFSDKEYLEILQKDLVINIFDENINDWVHQTTIFDALDIHEEMSPKKQVYLKPLNPGDLSSLTWVESEIPYGNESRKLIDIYYAPLNFKDVMYATGNLPIDLLYGVSAVEAKDSLLGLEFAGIDRDSGKRVFGPILFKGMATTVDITGAEDFIFDVPDNWSLEEASTIPAVYLTALYALIMKGKIQKGESILIHAGAGGVGLAALNICFHYKMKIFVTVGSEKKRKFLLKEFPELKEENILHSRSLKFEEELLKATNGRGVDLVLNSLAGEFLKASLRCLAKNGRFLEIGKADLIRDMKLNTPDYDDNKSFIGVCLDRIYKVPSGMKQHIYPNAEKDRYALKRILIQGIKDGYVKPIKRSLFEISRAEEAFRFMATGKHIGKILIKIRDENNNNHQLVDKPLKVTKQTFFYPHKSYIIIGGLGGLGLEVAQWMTERGAKRIVLASRRGVSEPFQQNLIHLMESKGVKVVVASYDATTEDGCIKIIESAYKMGAIGAIINSAAVLDDMMMDVMTPESFEKVASSKVLSTIFMDQLSREYCPELDYFIGFSSISNNRGNLGQTNYNYGNSVIDAICEKRRREGLHGLAIQWGIIGDVGLVINKGGYNGKIMLSTTTQRIESCLATLDKFMQTNESVVISFVKSRESNAAGDDGDLIKILNRVVGFKDIGSMDKTASLGSLGIDSLMAVELQQMIERVKGISISIKDLRQMTIKDFMDMNAAEKRQ